MNPGNRRRRSLRAGLTIRNQGLQIGFQSGPVLAGMLKQQLDQAPFAGSEMSMHPPLRQAVEQGHRLLGQKSLEFVSRHSLLVMSAR